MEKKTCKAMLKRHYNKRQCRLEAILFGYCIMHQPKPKKENHVTLVKQQSKEE